MYFIVFLAITSLHDDRTLIGMKEERNDIINLLTSFYRSRGHDYWLIVYVVIPELFLLIMRHWRLFVRKRQSL